MTHFIAPLLIVSLAVCFAPAAPAQDSANGSLLASYSESHLAPAVQAPRNVIELVLPVEENDARIFGECMKEESLRKGQEQKLFLVSELDLNSDGVPDYFVRPALEPWCLAYYGAHLFRYWFVIGSGTPTSATYRVLIASGGDGVIVHRATTNGWHDIETISHTAVTRYNSVWKWNGDNYAQSSCTVSEYRDGKVVSKKPCDV